MNMIAYFGFSRTTEVHVKPINLGCGAGQIKCVECNGSGDWSKFHPEPHLLTDYQKKCIECKGTGKILVSIT